MLIAVSITEMIILYKYVQPNQTKLAISVVVKKSKLEGEWNPLFLIVQLTDLPSCQTIWEMVKSEFCLCPVQNKSIPEMNYMA